MRGLGGTMPEAGDLAGVARPADRPVPRTACVARAEERLEWGSGILGCVSGTTAQGVRQEGTRRRGGGGSHVAAR
jgi:hypothetical protein